MKRMKQGQKWSFFFGPNESFIWYDDPQHLFSGVIQFLRCRFRIIKKNLTQYNNYKANFSEIEEFFFYLNEF
jgi:hypothetical protein